MTMRCGVIGREPLFRPQADSRGGCPETYTSDSVGMISRTLRTLKKKYYEKYREMLVVLPYRARLAISMCATRAKISKFITKSDRTSLSRYIFAFSLMVALVKAVLL